MDAGGGHPRQRGYRDPDRHAGSGRAADHGREVSRAGLRRVSSP
ncbi:MAG: hypothetical protein ACK55I_45615 [bacterium]